ncbi:MAG: FAD:protein FMN transferase [Gammaproteobacteria bacterium]|nr:FAD:protein FMN transferase [Gammaproteobacteria bacterium]
MAWLTARGEVTQALSMDGLNRAGWNLLLALALILTPSLIITGCSRDHVSSHQIVVFGTYVTISIWGAKPEQEQQAISAITRDFQKMHRDWHAWEPGALVEINQRLARGELVEVAPSSLSIIPLLKQAKELSEQSEGLFDPTIGALLKMWSFQQSERPNGPPPTNAKIDGWLNDRPTMADVTLTNSTVSSRNSKVQFDLGAFAKGVAVDRAMERLREFGIENAIVNGGGDLRAIGSKGGNPWRVGIRHPQGSGILAAIEVAGDESIFTSGNYERFNEYEGVRYAHILDPRTGRPVVGITSVTVIHKSGAVADAAATALVVAGVDGWQGIARKMGIKMAMVVEEGGVVHLDPQMRSRLIFEGDEPELKISDPL